MQFNQLAQHFASSFVISCAALPVQAVPMAGLPTLMASGQGGLLDIAVHPGDEGANVRVYMTMAHGTTDDDRAALVQGMFDGKRVQGIKTLFQASPSKTGGQHFGSRIAFMADGTLLMSIGDGGNPPQRVGNTLARDQARTSAATTVRSCA